MFCPPLHFIRRFRLETKWKKNQPCFQCALRKLKKKKKTAPTFCSSIARIHICFSDGIRLWIDCGCTTSRLHTRRLTESLECFIEIVHLHCDSFQTTIFVLSLFVFGRLYLLLKRVTCGHRHSVDWLKQINQRKWDMPFVRSMLIDFGFVCDDANWLSRLHQSIYSLNG